LEPQLALAWLARPWRKEQPLRAQALARRLARAQRPPELARLAQAKASAAA
jgi:hypothetical protein